MNPQYPEPRKVTRVVEVLLKGGVIAYPSDTVYGLGCDLMNKAAIERLYQIKGMQRDKSLAFICPDLSDIARYAIVEVAGQGRRPLAPVRLEETSLRNVYAPAPK